VVTDNDFAVSFDDLSDVLPNILGYLTPKDIMCKRRINKKSREAVKKTIVPPAYFSISARRYNDLRVMTEAMPNLQQIELRDNAGIAQTQKNKWSDGEDPHEFGADLAAYYASWISHDIGIISNFRKLRILEIYGCVLNGRYPVLFNSFPLLQKLSIQYCHYLKWDLDMLAGLPLLKELDCLANHSLGGNISNLRVLKNTLEKVTINHCQIVEGNFMDLADFPHLKELRLEHTAVTGDIRDIGENDFLALERLDLPEGVYGGNGYELQRISDAPDVVRAVYLFKKQRPALKMGDWYGKLSEDSPDWYEYVGEDGDTPPFNIYLVKAGPRVGYRWECDDGNPCEVNWLDPEPARESDDYAKYIEELQSINSKLDMYRLFYKPPTEEEYIGLH
jgi:hypothetical protein